MPSYSVLEVAASGGIVGACLGLLASAGGMRVERFEEDSSGYTITVRIVKPATSPSAPEARTQRPTDAGRGTT